MEIEILTGAEDAAKVATTSAVTNPITGTIKWVSSKTSEEFAFHPDAGKKALWSTYKKSEIEGEKGENITFPSVQFAIIAVGFRVVNVDEVNKEYWQSSLALDSRTDLISVWHGGGKLYDNMLYSALKAVMPKTAKYVTSLICVSLTKGTIFEIQAGQLLTESLCQDATKFLGKKVNTFGLVAQPPLVFLPPREGEPRLRRMLKDGSNYVEGKSKGECFFSPIHRVGILPESNALNETIKEQTKTFLEWASKSIKKAGSEEVKHEEKLESNRVAMEAQAPQTVVDKLKDQFQIVPPNPITVPEADITKLNDSDDLPF